MNKSSYDAWKSLNGGSLDTFLNSDGSYSRYGHSSQSDETMQAAFDPQEAAQGRKTQNNSQDSSIWTNSSRGYFDAEQELLHEKFDSTNHASGAYTDAAYTYTVPSTSADARDQGWMSPATISQDTMDAGMSNENNTAMGAAQSSLVSIVQPLDLQYAWTYLDEILKALREALNWPSFRSSFQTLKHRIALSATMVQLSQHDFTALMVQLYGCVNAAIDEIFLARSAKIERTFWLAYALCGEPNILAYPVSRQDRDDIAMALNGALPDFALEIRVTLLTVKEMNWRRQMYTEMEVTT